MPFNLLLDPFFPVLTGRGHHLWLSFPELVGKGEDDAVEFDWPRADFNSGALELAIGIATMAFPPRSSKDWRRLWDNPPSPEAMRAALAPFMHAFWLDGDGPRFLQELGGLEGETTPIEALLIDTPGANGQKKNADVLTHRSRYPAFGLPAAAMALYTLQQFAPSGGAGNRTSMRGGGPLSTFVLPGEANGGSSSLWRLIWANVPQRNIEFEKDDLPRIMPWLASTLISDKAHGERLVSQQDLAAHPLQAFFGMPRRIALRYAGTGPCAMTGEPGPLVDGFTQKPWGVNYGLWIHPLTPYRRQKEGADPYSVKPKSARFGYRDWTPVVVVQTHGIMAEPAENVRLARRDRQAVLYRGDGADSSLRVVGWAMNNMEAIAYLSAEQPLHLATDEVMQDKLDLAAVRFARSAEAVVSLLVQALRSALFSEGAKPSTDKTVFEQARSAFYEASEDAFHDLLDELLNTSMAAVDEAMRSWLGTLKRAAFAVFDAGAPIPLDDPEHAGRVARAFRSLSDGLSGFGKAGQALFQTLELPPPEESVARKGKHSAK